MTFEQFAADRLGALLRFATTLTSDRALGEDLVQDVLIRAHARWDRIEQLDQPYAYVRKMLANEFVSWRRKWARIVPHAEMPDTTAAPDHAGRQADQDAMRRAIARLPRRQRAVIVLRYYEDLSDDQIADVLDCTRSNVRGQAMRALRTLRIRQVGQLAPEPGSRG